MPLFLLGAFVFLSAVVVFIFQNNTEVTVHFLTWSSPEVSLAVVLLVGVCAGVLLTLMLDTYRYFKIAKKIKTLSNENKKLDKEVERLQRELSSRMAKEDTMNQSTNTEI